MAMKRIRLEPARDHEFPSGSSERGYEFAAPLDADAHLSADEWRKARERCRVKRFWPGERDEIGHLVHRRGGTWAFDYNTKGTEDDEPGFKFDHHRFIPGEYDGAELEEFISRLETLLGSEAAQDWQNKISRG